MPLKDIDLIIFDFDNTLYHSTKGYSDDVNLLYAEYLMERGITDDLQTARDLAKKFYKEKGHSILGFVEQGIAPEDYIKWVHDEIIRRKFIEQHIAERFVPEDLMAKVQTECVLFTQAARHYALHGLSISGLLPFFDEQHIHGLDTVGIHVDNMKHNTTTWAKLADMHGVPHHRVAVVEDSADYLKPPKQLGMRTIFVENDQYFHFNFKEVQGDHIDHHFKTTEDFLKSL